MAFNSGMKSSLTDEWATPTEFFKELDKEFQFKLDVCATSENTKCKRFFTKNDDGLSMNWKGICFMNPPYGRTIGKWVKKAVQEVKNGGGNTTVVALLPARTDTRWWHELIIPNATEIRFIKGRLHFNDSKTPAPFPSAVVVFKYGE